MRWWQLLLILICLSSIFSQPVEIVTYTDFLKNVDQSAVDYIISQWENADILILCERDHREATQYQLIKEVISHPYFIENVGIVFTEIGGRNYSERLNQILTDDSIPEKEARKKITNIYCDFYYQILWEKSAFLEILCYVDFLNRINETKIRVELSDIPIDWGNITREEYKNMIDNIGDRDKKIADHIISYIENETTSQKALVIMNYRHAFNNTPLDSQDPMDNVGRYIFDRFPGKVKNILLNTSVKDLENGGYKLVNNGLWDASFRIMDINDAGFDFENSPFGNDLFDMFPYFETKKKYKEIFSGMVYYKHLNEHKLSVGIPGISSNEFHKKFKKRLEIAGISWPMDKVLKWLAQLEEVKIFTYEDIDKYEKTIHSILK